MGALLYFVLLEGLSGATLGKRLLRVRVVDAHLRAPGVPRALVRMLARILDQGLGWWLGGLVVLVSPTRQRIGDLLAGTYVLDARALPARRG